MALSSTAGGWVAVIIGANAVDRREVLGGNSAVGYSAGMLLQHDGGKWEEVRVR